VSEQERDVAVLGNNSYGSLGDGTRKNRRSPVRVSGLSDVVDIRAAFHSLAIQNTIFTV